MTKTFLKSGNTFRVRDNDSVKAFGELPAATYTIKFDDRAGEFFLEQIENFTLPDKIYGKNTDYSNRILSTFNARPGSTGVLLSGIKGAGKTLLAKQTSVAARDQGIPTIVINRDWNGDEFNSFIQSISTPAIILFDEFEKIYGWSEQRKILTLFDGVFPSRKLFLVTTNTDRDVSEYMKNRPGRIYYNFEFDTLGQDFIQEFLEDRLDDKSQIEGILKYTQVFSFFNFDMLNAAVEEMNRYGESLTEVLEVLNIKPENRSTDTFKVEVVLEGKNFVVDRNYGNFQPNSFEYLLWMDNDTPKDIKEDQSAMDYLTNLLDESDYDEKYIAFNPTLIKRFDQVDNRFVYGIDRNGKNLELHITRNDPLDKWTYHPDAM